MIELTNDREREARAVRDHEQLKATWLRTGDALRRLKLLEVEAELIARRELK